MKTFIGIDLGSTTTKAIVLDSDASVLGRGITNSRSNYAIAADVAKRTPKPDFLDGGVRHAFSGKKKQRQKRVLKAHGQSSRSELMQRLR